MSGKLLKSVSAFTSPTLLSRVLGLVRDKAIAYVFGADAATDAFFVAFRIPNMLRRMFAEGAFSQGFVPVLADYYNQADPEPMRKAVSQIVGTLAIILLVVALIGVAGAPWLVTVMAPEYVNQPEKMQLTVDLLRIMFPYIFFISLVAASSGILNTFEKFAAPAFAPVWLNVCLIGAGLVFADQFDVPIYSLAWAVLLAGLIQFLFLLPFLWKVGMLVLPVWAWGSDAVKKVLRLMGPALLGSSVTQINLVINTILATTLVTGSVSWLYYSDRMVEFPIGIFGVALGTVILPRLSALHVQESQREFTATLDWALRIALMISLPATLGLMLLAGPIITTIFLGGQFTEADVGPTVAALTVYALGLNAFILNKVFSPGYFARKDTKTPVKYSAIAVVVNLVCSLTLMQFYGHVGLALGVAIAANVNTGMLGIGLWRRGVLSISKETWLVCLRVALSTIAMAATLWWFVPSLEEWFAWSVWQQIGQLGLWVAIGMVVFAISMLVLGLRRRHLVLKV